MELFAGCDAFNLGEMRKWDRENRLAATEANVNKVAFVVVVSRATDKQGLVAHECPRVPDLIDNH